MNNKFQLYLRVKKKIEETGHIMGSLYGLIAEKSENDRKRKYEINCKASEVRLFDLIFTFRFQIPGIQESPPSFLSSVLDLDFHS